MLPGINITERTRVPSTNKILLTYFTDVEESTSKSPSTGSIVDDPVYTTTVATASAAALKSAISASTFCSAFGGNPGSTQRTFSLDRSWVVAGAMVAPWRTLKAIASTTHVGKARRRCSGFAATGDTAWTAVTATLFRVSKWSSLTTMSCAAPQALSSASQRSLSWK